ncbi:MAG TPA: winged helix-turn-helix domain-containing protein, partial [Rhodobacterales bacterium]|nr:winged helix-turn-helix domain-containing protein [Rhodobacterales bacterium]
AKEWIAGADVAPVEVEAAGGQSYAAIAAADIDARLAAAPDPGQRVRLINPFDPLVRDRDRIERLFGFAYRHAMFVPKAQRVYGYYVYPRLEGLRFIGRIELRAVRTAGTLQVAGFWPEPGLRPSKARTARIEAELDRFRRFAGLSRVDWQAPPP